MGFFNLFKKKKKLEDLDLSWFKKSLENNDSDLDDDLQKISDELGIPKSELDLDKIIELCEIRVSDEEWESYLNDDSNETDEDIDDYEDDTDKYDELGYQKMLDKDGNYQYSLQVNNPITNFGKGLKEEFEGEFRKKIYSTSEGMVGLPTPLEEFRGYKFQEEWDENSEWSDWEGQYKEWRREICSDEEVISEFEMWDYFRNYYKVDISYSKEEPYDERGNEKYKTMKLLRSFRDEVKEKKYNKKDKSWSELDIGKIFRQMRVFMIGSKTNKLPNFVWKLDFRPFDYSFTICKNYVKWSGTKKTSKILFDNIVMWENGTLHRDGEPQKEYTDFPLWVNWNEIGKFFLSMKSKLKKEEGGIELLKEIGKYIESRKTFYNQLGEESNFNISTVMIEKFESLK
tara:strand:+ start:1018 stop:2217 length:1200 start_codon:yes stop_codon:yes gene_type:complete